MAYFIHNKYDKDSKAKVTLVSGTNYTYKADNTVTVIDYFGLLESGVKTYQYLDTAYMGIQTVASLVYTTIDTTNLLGKTPTTDGKSIIEFATGVINILEKLQILVGEKSDTGGGVSDGTIMAKINRLVSLQTENILTEIRPSLMNVLKMYYVYKTGSSTISKTITFTPNVNGEICFFIGYCLNGYSGYTGEFNLAINGTELISKKSGTSTSDTVSGELIMPYSVLAGTTYTIVLEVYTGKSATAIINKFAMCGIGNNNITENLGTIVSSN
ncbi:MAG: hypothetical protein VB119_04345 [Candidatus Metalachnospira sp.]|nr:hypothetical protein [Candidatus Metalachnospira sp.]